MIQDLLWALRWLRKNPLFTAAATGILGLGIGANTAVFSIVDAVLLRPLPYQSSGLLVRVDETAAKRLISGVPAQDYMRWRDRSDLFEKTVPFLRDIVTITGAGDPDQVIALRTAGGLFPLLGMRPRIGRALVDSDDEPGSAKVAVISDRLWRRRFHGDPAAVGRPITVSEEVFTIAGVMGPEFEFPASDVELWTPLRVTPAITMWLQVLARLKSGITPGQAGSALEVVARQMEQEDPKEKAGLRIDVTPWSETADRKYQLTLVFVLVAVGLVLLIACADVGSLLLSRAVERQREIAIRASLGAGFWRVVRQLLAESFVLAVLGSAAGITVAHYALRLLANRLAALPVVLPHLQRVALNGRVLLFNTALCLLLAVLCSLAPVLLAGRTDIQGVLRGGRAGWRSKGGSKGPARIFAVLIASEAAFAFLLLVGSGLMIRSLVRLQQEDHGFRPDHVLTMRVPVGMRTQLGPAGKYNTRPRQIAYYREILERIERIPGIQAAIVNNLPLSGVSSSIALKALDGRPVLNSTRTISPRYFAVMGIPLIAGRVFTDADQAGAPGVAIINEYLARQLFPDRSPVGEALPSGESNGPGSTVVGVVKNTSQLSYDQPAKGELYVPIRQFIFAAFMSTIVVRTAGDPLAPAAALQKEVWAVDPNQPVVKVETMNDVITDSIWRPRFSAWIFTVLGSLAVLLTSGGVYGVVAYTSTLQAHEVGIRVALGATPRQVVAVILRGAMVPLAAGLSTGVVAALFLSKLLASLLYEVGSSDAVTYCSACVLVLGIGATASAGPAWRAATGDPLRALRSE
ncbi:MAG TPA: ABC transporter permease [Candidatus Acidoferrales bacterium]|jgi:putative ABC transport system permease protein|nr:ABC transporter permease [Candidatus Acidoferrales bacterium]